MAASPPLGPGQGKVQPVLPGVNQSCLKAGLAEAGDARTKVEGEEGVQQIGRGPAEERKGTSRGDVVGGGDSPAVRDEGEG